MNLRNNLQSFTKIKLVIMRQEIITLKYVFKKILEKVEQTELTSFKDEKPLKSYTNYYRNIIPCFDEFVQIVGFKNLTKSIVDFKIHTGLS